MKMSAAGTIFFKLPGYINKITATVAAVILFKKSSKMLSLFSGHNFFCCINNKRRIQTIFG